LLEVQQRRRIGEVGGIINDLLDNMFNDDVTQLTTNTDINSTILDPQIVGLIAGRGSVDKQPIPAKSSTDISQSLTSPSSTIAEAGSGSADRDDLFMRRGRGVQPGDIRGSYNKPKKIAQDILGDIIGEAVTQGESRKRGGAKGGGI
jgi:hypothetical protein